MGEFSEPIHLLHVDDEPNLAEMVAEFVMRVDDQITVDTATSASDGHELLQENDYDCIVSDYEMPGQDGVEFLKVVREDYPALPFLLYTGKGNEEVASEAIAAGVTDYLQKDSGTSQYEVLANRVRNAVERHRANQQVIETQTWATMLLDYSSDYIFVVDRNGEITYVSSAVERILGYGTEEVTGSNAFEFTHPADIEKATDAFTKLLESPQMDVTVEFRAKHADGGNRWLEVRGRNLFDDPIIDGVLVNARDITDRKKHEQELRQFRREYEMVLETAQDAIFIFDVDETDSGYAFYLRRLNSAHEATSGLSMSEDRGKTPVELLGEEDGGEIAANFRRCVETSEAISYEEELEMPAGTFYWQTNLSPVIMEGQVTQLVGIARDITERKKSE